MTTMKLTMTLSIGEQEEADWVTLTYDVPGGVIVPDTTELMFGIAAARGYGATVEQKWTHGGIEEDFDSLVSLLDSRGSDDQIRKHKKALKTFEAQAHDRR